ncbi:hypothetical protein BCR33DRAFT_170712 [Rhizoclosmatium globosum]|uniref:Uncharacterized protein n=1 Tax=Rhizoclosmatium globosum TaxID=329046 RepID=A0A1Y2CGZ8_9FUNG|nr:hypothetical protein BCR33DRAFT_170712 [Rhizoclosmatium globosum]|eukprot:ORY45585.1 hypothetical protein BCR33DRAFT_170712 [Rhizoclosmatium globosum]
MASHHSELNHSLKQSKFFIPSVLEQQKEILAQQDREIKALKEESKKSYIWMNEFQEKQTDGFSGMPLHGTQHHKQDNNDARTKYLKDDFFGQEKHKLEKIRDNLQSESRLIFPDGSFKEQKKEEWPFVQSVESSVQSSRANSAFAKYGRRGGPSNKQHPPHSAGSSLNVKGIEALNDERLKKLRELDDLLTRHPDHLVNDFLMKGQR